MDSERHFCFISQHQNRKIGLLHGLERVNKTRLSDRVLIDLLHKKAKLLSLEQRGQKQLLTLMYIYSKNDNIRYVPARATAKFIFKIESKIGTKYEHSPYYMGP